MLRATTSHALFAALTAATFQLSGTAPGRSGIIASQPDTASRGQLESLVRSWCPALMRKDTAFFDRVVDPDYRAVSATGAVQTKQQLLASVKNTATALTICDETEVNVRQSGDTAVVTLIGRYEGVYKGARFANQPGQWTDTWVRRTGTWKLVAARAKPNDQSASRIPDALMMPASGACALAGGSGSAG